MSRSIEEYIFRTLQHEAPECVPLGLSVRVVHSVDETLAVNARHVEAFGGPDRLPFRNKVIMIFQHISTGDILLLVLYVCEFAADGIGKNSRLAHIHYVDSVPMLVPGAARAANGQSMQAFVFQTCILGYMSYVRNRGFARCYAWACAPAEGEEYILHCRSPSRKALSQAGLEVWYTRLFERAVKEGIAQEVSKPPFDQGCYPYLDGDIWSTEVERAGVAGARETTSRLARAVFCAELSRDSTPIVDPDSVTFTPICDSRVDLSAFFRDNALQFDSSRNARHATASLLYYLHNPEEYAASAQCDLCDQPIYDGGWECRMCGFDVCLHCMGIRDHGHVHQLTEVTRRRMPLLLR
jgi:hypothetical protein